MKYIFFILILFTVAAPATALVFYKPSRLLLPEHFGVNCQNRICVDNTNQTEIAATLFNNAKANLAHDHGLVINNPRIIFCSTEKCSHSFGLGKRAGYTLGTFGIVISPRGWKEYYVAHELIHFWQADHYGNLAQLNGEPWVIEGMAYALSDDPRKELHEPFESYRQQFNEWYQLNKDVPLTQSISTIITN